MGPECGFGDLLPCRWPVFLTAKLGDKIQRGLGGFSASRLKILLQLSPLLAVCQSEGQKIKE